MTAQSPKSGPQIEPSSSVRSTPRDKRSGGLTRQPCSLKSLLPVSALPVEMVRFAFPLMP